MEGSASREPLNSEDGQSGATETEVLAESTEEQAGLTVREELIPPEFQSGPIQTCTNSSCDRYRMHSFPSSCSFSSVWFLRMFGWSKGAHEH